MAGTFSINGEPYRIVDPSRVGTRAKVYSEIMRPSQPSEARLNTKTWTLSGPIGNSRQRTFTDPLGPDYTVDLDGRNAGLLTSAPLRTALTLTAITEFAYGVPISDVSKTNWTEGAGDANGNAFEELDEGIISGTPDDATTYWTNAGNTGFANRLELNITSLTDPGVDTGHTMRFRYRHSVNGDTLYFSLKQTGIGDIYTLANLVHTTNWETITIAIPETSIANITDYTALQLKADIQVGSGTLDVSTMELEIPNAEFGNVITIDEDRGELFAQRGSHSTQVSPGTMAEAQDVNHGAVITDSLAAWQGSGFVALGATAAKKRTAVVSGTSATYANVTSVDANKLAVGPDRLWLSDASDGQVKFVTDDLVDSTDVSNGIQVADPNSGTITGLYTLGELMIAGTQRGPRSFIDAGAPAVLGEAVKAFPTSLNGAAGDSLWGWHYHATKLGLYAIQPEIPIENPVGPGEGLDGQRFEGPIDGYPIAVKAFKDSLWVSYLSTDGDSWLLRGTYGPQTAATGRPEWFVFRKLTGVVCNAIGATTGRAVPAVVWGEGENLAYSDLAFRGREIADTTNYVYGTDGGEWYGTTLTLPVGLVGNVRWAKFLTENCDGTNTWQLATSRDEAAQVDLGAVANTNGLQTVRPTTASVPDAMSFTTLKPRLTQVAASSTAPPQIRGDLTIAYDERPEHVREIEVLIEGHGSDLADLQTLADAGTTTPHAITIKTDTGVNTSIYGYVIEVEQEDLRDPSDQGIRVKLIEWATS